MRLKAEAQRLLQKAAALERRASARMENNPGSFITGRSGRSARQDRCWAAAMDRSLDNLKAAEALRLRSAQLTRQAYELEHAVELAEKKAKRKAAEKAADRDVARTCPYCPKDGWGEGLHQDGCIYTRLYQLPESLRCWPEQEEEVGA